MKDTQLKVIIADSNVQDRESKQLSMESKGMEVILSTGDGNKVLRAVSDGKADVIVMDMILSGLDGIGILSREEKNFLMIQNQNLRLTDCFHRYRQEISKNLILSLRLMYRVLLRQLSRVSLNSATMRLP